MRRGTKALFPAYATPVIRERPQPRITVLERNNDKKSARLNGQWFDYLDVCTAHGAQLTLRDYVRIGKKLKISIFNDVNVGDPWTLPIYERGNGELLTETFPQFALKWFSPMHQRTLEHLTHYYLFDNAIPSTTPPPSLTGTLTHTAYGMALHFIQRSESYHGQSLTFISNWYHNSEHLCGLKRAEALDAIQCLVKCGVIESMSKAVSTYRFIIGDKHAKPEGL